MSTKRRTALEKEYDAVYFLEVGERLKMPDAVSWQAFALFSKQMQVLLLKKSQRLDKGIQKGQQAKKNNKKKAFLGCRIPAKLWSAYFVYKAARDFDCPFLLKQVAEACEVSEKGLWRLMLQQQDHALLTTHVSAEHLFYKYAELFQLRVSERKEALAMVRQISKEHCELSSKTILAHCLFLILGPKRRQQKRDRATSEQNGRQPLTARERAIHGWGLSTAARQEMKLAPPQPMSARALCQALGTSTTSMFRLKRLLTNQKRESKP